MIKYTLFKRLFTAMIILTVLAFIGCEKKTEQQQSEVKSESTSPDSMSKVSEPEVGKPISEETVAIQDLKGTWTGTFDKRATTLKITEQKDSSFSGKISIKYREMLNQEIKGTFSPTTKKVSMSDQLHSRFMGKYNGTLSENGKGISGTFTMNSDGSKFSFNLNKK
jgi:uncharacterized lipoprotein NlpE involved in copper resistance